MADTTWNKGIAAPQYLNTGVIPMYKEEGTANEAPINNKVGFLRKRPTAEIISELIVAVQNMIAM